MGKDCIYLRIGQACISGKDCRRLPLSPNKLNSMHWAQKAKWKKAWEDEVLYTWMSVRSNYLKLCEEMPFKKALLTVSFFRVRKTDEDNDYASLKPILDGLVKAKIIADDRCDHLKTNLINVPIAHFDAEHIELVIKKL